jgi:hypothetical protein
MRLSDVLQDRLDTANKSRSHVMAMAIQKQKRIEELEESNKELTLQFFAALKSDFARTVLAELEGGEEC